jgi:hypothetical protein
MLKHFSVDKLRHKLVVDVEFYQMNLSGAVEWARLADPSAFIEDGVFLPAWAKFAAAPVKAKGFWCHMLQSIFEGKHSLDEINIDLQTGAIAERKVVMMFLPGSMRNDALLEAEGYAKQALSGFAVMAICGATDITNATAEKDVTEFIEKAEDSGKSVLLLSCGMAQRSFSIPEITELYLAYDEGSNAATIQKMSRALTPDKEGKVGRIISLSFDPNRDDKFDALIIETAINYKKNKNKRSLREAMRDVLRTIDIFTCQPSGSLRIDPDVYIQQSLERNSLGRVLGKIADLSKLSFAEMESLVEGKNEIFINDKTKITEKGKTRPKDKARNKGIKTEEKNLQKMIEKARKVIVTIAENADILLSGTNCKTLKDALEKISEDAEYQTSIEEEFMLGFDIIQILFDRGVINGDLIEILVDK